MSTLIFPDSSVASDISHLKPIPKEEYNQPNDLIRHFAPWSVSRAKMADRCPLQFRWQYLDRRKGDEEIQNDELSLKMGKTMHELYENHFKGDSKKLAYVKAVQNNKLTRDEQKEMKKMVKGVSWFSEKLTSFVEDKVVKEDETFISLNQLEYSGRLGIEKRFSLDEDFKDTGNFGKCFLRGVIDVVMFTKDNGAVILDHKSSSYPSLKFFKTQLRIYAAAILANYPHLDWVQCGVHFMPLQQIKLDTVIYRDSFDSLKRGVYFYLSNAANSVLQNELRIANHCKWCQYRESCKKLRREIRRSNKI